MNPELQNILNIIGGNQMQFTSVTPRRVSLANVINEYHEPVKAAKPETIKDRAEAAVDLAQKLVSVATAHGELSEKIKAHIERKAIALKDLEHLQATINEYEINISDMIDQRDKLLSDYEDVAKTLGAVRLT